jgi:drug/metabolite transporter (DMT)-like permease
MATHVTGAGLRNLPTRAIAYMLAASFLIIVLDTAVKWLAKAYSPLQIGFVRYVIGVAIAAGIATRAGGIGTLRTRRVGGHLLRSALNLTTMLSFYYALRLLPLADSIAINFAAPLFVTAFSGPMLGEHVGVRRWTAVACGFVGVLLAVQPSPAGISPGATLALLSALTWALTIVTSRQISSTESSHTILFYYSLAVVIVLGAAMPALWIPPSPHDWLWFVVVGIAGSFGQFCYNQAFRYGEASLVAPLDYLGIVWATLFGFVVFGDIPSWLVLGGGACIIASSIYIAQREAVAARRRRGAGA